MADNLNNSNIPNIFYHNRESCDLYDSLDFVYGEWDKAEQHESILDSEKFERNLELLRLSLEKKKLDVLRKLNDNIENYLNRNQ